MLALLKFQKIPQVYTFFISCYLISSRSSSQNVCLSRPLLPPYIAFSIYSVILDWFHNAFQCTSESSEYKTNNRANKPIHSLHKRKAFYSPFFFVHIKIPIQLTLCLAVRFDFLCVFDFIESLIRFFGQHKLANIPIFFSSSFHWLCYLTCNIKYWKKILFQRVWKDARCYYTSGYNFLPNLNFECFSFFFQKHFFIVFLVASHWIFLDKLSNS